MKYCPNCNERYDEEVIIFCTKDGTPLVEEKQPNFTALPSEGLHQTDEDLGEETVIRRRSVERTDDSLTYDSSGQSERIVIPTTPAQSEQRVRPRTTQAYNPPPPPPPNTAKTVVLTIFGTLVVLGFGAGLFWLLQKDNPANLNVNNANLANQNVNLNTNLGFDSNFNFDTNSSLNTGNLNTNFNSDFRTPTPTPTPRPTSTPTPEPSATPTPAPPSPTPRPTLDSRPPDSTTPTPLGTPRTGPRPPTPTPQPNINGN